MNEANSDYISMRISAIPHRVWFDDNSRAWTCLHVRWDYFSGKLDLILFRIQQH